MESTEPDSMTIKTFSDERQQIYLEAMLDDLQARREDTQKLSSKRVVWDIININLCSIVNLVQLVLILVLLRKFG